MAARQRAGARPGPQQEIVERLASVSLRRCGWTLELRVATLALGDPRATEIWNARAASALRSAVAAAVLVVTSDDRVREAISRTPSQRTGEERRRAGR